SFFFCASRRRHTRLVSDWSSDVCSSDLCCLRGAGETTADVPETLFALGALAAVLDLAAGAVVFAGGLGAAAAGSGAGVSSRTMEIGRASCRERGEIWVEGGV